MARHSIFTPTLLKKQFLGPTLLLWGLAIVSGVTLDRVQAQAPSTSTPSSAPTKTQPPASKTPAKPSSLEPLPNEFIEKAPGPIRTPDPRKVTGPPVTSPTPSTSAEKTEVKPAETKPTQAKPPTGQTAPHQTGIATHSTQSAYGKATHKS
ncbi:hypothetical protein [Acaryochloris sp. 'Moss Beach']|uniref:hypothetical protein n=1 Tax=Acaryochloris sp. 'Moss Beach' TaxID=2740837 RepID=UPI001F434F37|nr:hypothetical protein [Acaryochloris sp. 'Moss Beach']